MTGKHWEQSEWPRPWPKQTQREVQVRRDALPRPEEWMERGACVGKWPEWDYSIDGENRYEREARVRRAAQVCRNACPVLAECRAWADSARTVGEFGVCAGRIPKGTDEHGNQRDWREVA